MILANNATYVIFPHNVRTVRTLFQKGTYTVAVALCAWLVTRRRDDVSGLLQARDRNEQISDHPRGDETRTERKDERREERAVDKA